MDPRLLRLIDANANRAREALRVMEDISRFVLDDAGLSARFKDLRHGLRDALEALAAVPLSTVSLPVTDGLASLACRDTPNDVGVENKTPAESTRADIRSVAIAAGKRAGEALRTLEESAKVFRPAPGSRTGPLPAPWQVMESLRYALYSCEQQLLLSLGTGRARQWRLCVLISQSLCRTPWQDVVLASIRGGADCIQLREKPLNDRAFLEMARCARRLISSAPGAAVSLIINDRVDLALLAQADGVHLGQDDLPVREARQLGGERLLIGVSTHDLAEARHAVQSGADYCGVGAMFPTATKQRATSGVEFLRQYLADPALSAVPHLAIGGITPANVAQLALAPGPTAGAATLAGVPGCRGVAVSSAVCGADDPEAVCRAIIAGLRTPAAPEPDRGRPGTVHT